MGRLMLIKSKFSQSFFSFKINVVKWACLEFLKLSYISWQLQDFLAMSIVPCKCYFFIRRNKIFRNKVSKVSFGYSINKFPLMGTENFFLGPTLVTRCCSLRFFFFERMGLIPFHYQDLWSNSSYCLPYNFNKVS